MRVARLLPLLLLAALAPAAPAAAHEDGAVELPEQSIGGVAAELHGDRIPEDSDAQLLRASTRRALTRVAALGTATPQLADTWCGTPRASDDTANAAAGPGAAIKVVYARPSDVADRFAARADLIQRDARDISTSFALAANGARTVRFDVGTSCGAANLDITSLTLPRTRAAYLGMSLNARVNALQIDLSGFAGGLTGTHDVLVYLEDLNAGDGVDGVATLYADDRHGATNASNRGGQFAFVLGDLDAGNRRTTAQHELGHNLGAVQDSAPHSTLAGHCFERYDVMCYADGGPRGQVGNLVTACATPSAPAWDCGAGDYFDPSPPAGSYLATHWNLLDSAYLCAPAECFVGGGATSTAPSPGPAASGGGSGGGGSSAGAPTAPTGAGTESSTAPVGPPKILPAATPIAIATTAAQLARVLDHARHAFRRGAALTALRRGRTVRVSVTPPVSGTLTARLTVRGRTVVRASSVARAGRRGAVVLRAFAAARRTLRAARPGQLTLRLSLRHAEPRSAPMVVGDAPATP
jgi:hypothetical protein